jgi:trk system potassium uptake protein TrkH
MSLYRQVQPLWLPARLPTLRRLMGHLSLILAVLLAVPALFAAWAGDAALGWRLLLAGVLPALALGLSARRRPEDPPPRTNEALMVAALAFILAAGLLTYPFMAAGLGLLDAWFEAVSAVTTTGLSMAPTPEGQSDAFLFARAWGQWFGGIGMVVLSLALAFGRVADMPGWRMPLGRRRIRHAVSAPMLGASWPFMWS